MINIQNLKKLLTCSAYYKIWSAQKNMDRQKYKLHKQSLSNCTPRIGPLPKIEWKMTSFLVFSWRHWKKQQLPYSCQQKHTFFGDLIGKLSIWDWILWTKAFYWNSIYLVCLLSPSIWFVNLISSPICLDDVNFHKIKRFIINKTINGTKVWTRNCQRIQK